MILLERIQFLDDSSADQPHSVHDVLVKKLDGRLTGFGLPMTQDMMINQGDNDKDGGEREDWVKEADFLNEYDEQAEVE